MNNPGAWDVVHNSFHAGKDLSARIAGLDSWTNFKLYVKQSRAAFYPRTYMYIQGSPKSKQQTVVHIVSKYLPIFKTFHRHIL